MSGLMPKTPPHVYEPLPSQVRDFSERNMPAHVRQAEQEMQFADRELRRPVDLRSVEDVGDREDVIAMRHSADKVVCSNAERMGSYLRSLS